MDSPMPSAGSIFNFTTQEVKEMTPDDVLLAARQVRFKTIEIVTQNGIPTENADIMQVLEQNLRGLENQAIQNKRIKADESAGKNLVAVAQAIVAEIISERPSTGRRLETPVAPPQPLALPAEIETPPMVPGEDDPIGASPETIDQFLTRMNG